MPDQQNLNTYFPSNVGLSGLHVRNDYVYDTNPTSAQFRNFYPGDRWLNIASGRLWVMTEKTVNSGTWIEFAGGLGDVVSLTGKSGGPVFVDTNNNINIVGSGFVTITGVPGTHTLTATVSGTGLLTWQTIGASQTLAVNNGYICTGGVNLALALPAVSAIGDIIEITLDGSTSFQITQAAGQSIKVGSGTTTAGIGGSITSTMQGDSIRLVCSVQNLRWNVLSTVGNFTTV